MKQIITLFSLLLCHIGFAQNVNKLMLTLKPDNEYVKVGDYKRFKLVITNVSKEPVTILSRTKIDPFWGGYKYASHVEINGKTTTALENLMLPYKKPKNEGLITLNAGENAEVMTGSIKVTEHGIHKYYVTYTQDPSIMTAEYQKALKKNYDKLSYFELTSDTLIYDNTLVINELSEPISYNDLTSIEKRGTTTILRYYQIETNLSGVAFTSSDMSQIIKLKIDLKSKSDKEAMHYIPYLKNVHWLTIDITDTIPQLTNHFKNLKYLHLNVAGNSVRKIDIQGLEQFKRLTQLEHIELFGTYQTGDQSWICNNKDLRVLNLRQGMDKLPPCIGTLSKLENFTIDKWVNNYHTQVPAEFNKLTSLKELRILDNDVQFEPNFILRNPGLRKVFLQMSNVDLFPSFANTGVVDLELAITKGDVPHYPKGIENMPKLEKIVLDGRFGNIEAPNFEACTSLNFFVIRDKKMTIAPQSVYKLRERVPKTYVHAPNLIEPFNLPK